MSEIGPISVSPRLRCRMISCPAANGIICSICNPSATEQPSGTWAAIASRMERSLDMNAGALNNPVEVVTAHAQDLDRLAQVALSRTKSQRPAKELRHSL